MKHINRTNHRTRLLQPIHGFTLIELLVVVAIIAVLIAILLPALATARNQAKKVVCQSNLAQVGFGFRYYLDAYKEYYPYYCKTTTVFDGYDNRQYDHWNKMMVKEKFIANKNVYYCPADANVSGYLWDDNNSNSSDSSVGYSLGLSINYDGTKAWGYYDRSRARLPRLGSPDKTILVVDSCVDGYSDKGAIFVYPWWNWSAGGGPFAYIRHQGYCNVVWTDGHVTGVRAVNPRDISTIYWNVHNNPLALTSAWVNPNYWDRN